MLVVVVSLVSLQVLPRTLDLPSSASPESLGDTGANDLQHLHPEDEHLATWASECADCLAIFSVVLVRHQGSEVNLY